MPFNVPTEKKVEATAYTRVDDHYVAADLWYNISNALDKIYSFDDGKQYSNPFDDVKVFKVTITIEQV